MYRQYAAPVKLYLYGNQTGITFSGSRINARRVDVSRFAASGAQQQRTHQHGEQH